MKNFFKILIKLLNILFIILTLVLLFISIFKKEYFELFIEWLKVFIAGLGNLNYLIVFLSSLVESFPVLGILVPGQNILMVVGGFFGNISRYHLITVGILAALGSIAGNFIGYYLGGKFGDDFFRKYGNWFGVGLTEVAYLKTSIHKWGALGIIFGKFHPLTRSFLPFIAGTMGMKKTSFMIYNTIGSIIWSITMVLLGMIFVEYYKIILQYIDKIVLVGIFGLGLYIYFFKKEAFLKYWKAKEAEMEELYGKNKKTS